MKETNNTGASASARFKKLTLLISQLADLLYHKERLTERLTSDSTTSTATTGVDSENPASIDRTSNSNSDLLRVFPTLTTLSQEELVALETSFQLALDVARTTLTPGTEMTAVEDRDGPSRRPPADSPSESEEETSAQEPGCPLEPFGEEPTSGRRMTDLADRSGNSLSALKANSLFLKSTTPTMAHSGTETPSGTTGTGDATGTNPTGTGDPTKEETGEPGGETDPSEETGTDFSGTGTPTSDSGGDSQETTSGLNPLTSRTRPSAELLTSPETTLSSEEMEKELPSTGSNFKDSEDGE